MKFRFKQFFPFSRMEKMGLVAVMFLVVAASLYDDIYIKYFLVHKRYETEKTKKLFAEFVEAGRKEYEVYPFNPNTATKNMLMSFGLSIEVAETIWIYRMHGGVFYKKDDLLKISNLPESDFLRLEPYIVFDQDVDKKRRENRYKIKKKEPIEYFKFNPNLATKEQLKKLGLSTKVVNTIIKYRDRGRFNHPKDLSKIYGLAMADYYRLEPYIVIEKNAFYKPKNKDNEGKREYVKNKYKGKEKKKPRYKAVKVDINKSTAEDWKEIYGIGEVLSARIVKYRDKLGGFYAIEQVGTVYGLTDSTFQLIKSHLVFSPLFKKIDINVLSIDELKLHPYIKWKHARIIVNYRDNHGPYKSIKDLENALPFPEMIKQIEPYLDFRINGTGK